ncbi:MAG: transposase [Deltaproteobacteria bacterium]|nr:transposase [Deltaproteobacteria bacterium]MBW2018284.1 transposase [Deltaproteobacteria bacterium]
MTREERSNHWQRIIEQQEASGLSGAAFCREHQINPHAFYRWRRRLRTEQDSQGTQSGFYQLVPCTSQSQGSGVHIHLGQSLRIELDRGFDPFTLRTVLEAVGGTRPCCP